MDKKNARVHNCKRTKTSITNANPPFFNRIVLTNFYFNMFIVVVICVVVISQSAHLSNHTHHRTKSSPDPLMIMSPGESSRRLVASESLNDLSRTNENWENPATPPGTPPPPYPSPVAHKKLISSNRNSANTEDGDSHDEVYIC